MQTHDPRRARRWLIGYLAVLLGTLPAALPCWNGFLRDAIGRFITIEAVHLLQYGVLGWLTANAGQAVAPARRRRLVGLAAGVGVIDELIQGWLPQRVFQWSDVALNWTGLLAGLVLWRVGAAVGRLKGAG